MNMIEEIEKLTLANPKQALQNVQLEQLEEVEKVLTSLGVSLEPKFEMSPNSRYGFFHKPTPPIS